MTQENPFVSVIMPCYNAENLLARSIDSVIAQRYQNWELLIIDDCSTDNSTKVIDEYCSKDSRIRHLRTSAQSGSPAEPRNMGIRNARGRYIAFLDSDDLWLPSKLEHQIAVFQNADDAVAVVFSDYEKFSDEANFAQNRVVKAPKKITYQRLLKGNCIGNLTGMFDTSKTGKIFQKQIGHEDYLFWLNCLKAGFLATNTRTVEARYRQVNTSISGNKGDAFKWTWSIYYNELKLGFLKSIYYFSFYAIKGLLKFIK